MSALGVFILKLEADPAQLRPAGLGHTLFNCVSVLNVSQDHTLDI